MNDWTTFAAHLRHWFAKYNIPTDSVTIIVNIAEVNPAAAFDAAFRNEFDAFKLHPEADTFAPLDMRQGMQIYGLKFRLESPLHADPGGVVIMRFVPPPR